MIISVRKNKWGDNHNKNLCLQNRTPSMLISCLNVKYAGKKLGIGKVDVIITVISKRDKIFETSSNCSQKADCCVVSISLSLQTRSICCALTIVLHIQSLNND